MAVSLTTRERSHLKARAHALEARVQVGHSGSTDAVVAEVDRALAAHELIKMKILDNDREVRRKIADAICVKTDAALVQSVGKVFILWRPKPNETADD